MEQEVNWGYLSVSPVDIGEKTYIGEWSHISQYTKIGKFCSIANLVTIGAQKHFTDYLTTFPIEHLFEGMRAGEETVVGNDVWIGSNSVIKAGVKIGDGAVIGCGSVVLKDVKPYEIVVGNPAKHLRYRFPDEVIENLLRLKWWELPLETIKILPFENVNHCIDSLETLERLQAKVT